MEEKINQLRVKPRFKLSTDRKIEDCEHHLRNSLLDTDLGVQGNINREVSTLWIKTAHNEFWKPYLALRTETEEGKTVIRGIFGPSAAVWTFFMFLYFLFGVTFMVFVSIWAITRQIKSPDFPWAPEVTVLSAALLAITFIATKVGQRKAKNEMEQLKAFAEKALTELTAPQDPSF